MLLDSIEVGWGRDNPAFRQIFTSLFIPGGTPEQHATDRYLKLAAAIGCDVDGHPLDQRLPQRSLGTSSDQGC